MNNAKENPLNIPIYKLSGKDGRGAWFARRSVHKGLPFSRWKSKMQVEMDETLKARQEELKQGRVPATSIRGIGGDRRLEQVEIKESDTEKALGKVEVYELSAQFPGPTTPRDFVTLMITSDAMLSDGADSDLVLPPTYIIVSKPCQHPDAPERDDYIRGQYESVELIRELPIVKTTAIAAHAKRPASTRSTTTHDSTSLHRDSAPNGDGSKSTGRPRGQTEPPVPVELDGSSGNEAVDPNPVEWIMITRSDPGGSVPRWMVERGTPKSITGDAVKFLNWASEPDQLGEGEDVADIGEVTKSVEAGRRLSADGIDEGRLSSKDGTTVADQEPDAVGTEDKGIDQLDQSAQKENYDGNDKGQRTDGSLLSSVAKVVQGYTPKAVLNYIPASLSPSPGEEKAGRTVAMRDAKAGRSEGELSDEHDTEVDDDFSSMASDDSFASAGSHISPTLSRDLRPPIFIGESSNTHISPQLASGVSSEAALISQSQSDPTKSKPSQKEKELAKLNSRKREVEVKLATTQSEIRELVGQTGSKSVKSDVDSTRGSMLSVESDAKIEEESGNSTITTTTKEAAQNQKRIDHLARTESKLVSRLNKIEAQQLKVIRKLEADQRKAANRDEKTRSKSEVDNLKREIFNLRKEVQRLRGERTKWLEIVGTLQKENTELVAQMEKYSQGVGGSQDGLQ